MSCRNFVVIPLFAVFLAACGSMPKTPDLLVENAKGGGMFSEKETFEVSRPIAQVSDVLRKKAHECLQQQITSVTQGDSSGGIRLQQRQVQALTPKVTTDKQRTRLTLQVKTTQGPTELGDIPPDGWYMLVVDAYPLGASRTRVESYYQHSSYHGAYTAIKLWVTGANMGCPDLTQ